MPDTPIDNDEIDDEDGDIESPLVQCESLLTSWRAERNLPNFDPTNLLNRMSDLLEDQVTVFFGKDPDPYDTRHPLRADHNCDLGQLLRLLAQNESFVERVSFFYLVQSDDPHNPVVIAACRLLCTLRLGVSITHSEDEDDLVLNTLFNLARTDAEPTNCYARFLLGSIHEETDLTHITRSNNIELIPVVMQQLNSYADVIKTSLASDVSQQTSNGMEKLLGHFHLSPMSVEMKARLSIAYLVPLAEYQDLMPLIYNHNVLSLLLFFISPEVASRDIRLAFEALRLLGNLLCHRRVYLDFVDGGGIQAVLQLSRPSVAATAVGVVLYYTAYFEDAMERVCQLPRAVLVDMMSYALWLLECSHPSARCYSLYFLNLVLCYGSLFQIFVEKNGLVYLFNAICLLPIRLTEDHPSNVKDNASWHIVRASLATIKRYLEVSLLLWIDNSDSTLVSIFDESPRFVASVGCRPISYTGDQMTRLMSNVVYRIRPDTVWRPTQQLQTLGAIDVLFRIISRNVHVHITLPARNECTRLAVDILNFMSLTCELAKQITSTDVYAFPSGSSPILASPPPGGGELSLSERVMGQFMDAFRDEPTGHSLSSRAGRTPGLPSFTPVEQGDSVGVAGGASLSRHPGGADTTVNGLHMLFTILMEADWDVGVFKSILIFIGTLVFRPLASNDHPTHPMPVSTLMTGSASRTVINDTRDHSPPLPLQSPNAIAGGPCSTPCRMAITPTTNKSSSVAFASPCSTLSRHRKRRLDDSLNQPSHPIVWPTSNQTSLTPLYTVNPNLMSSSSSTHRPPKDLKLLACQTHLWQAVRRHHGLLALLHHIECRDPASYADRIRTLACRGLVGMARSDEVRTILAKMPLFTKALIQLLMREPVLGDRLSEHAEFCRYATILIRLVIGTLNGNILSSDLSLERMRRAEIVARTRIVWDHDELLELIHKHLLSKGLHESAFALQREAQLKVSHPLPGHIPLYLGETPPHQSSTDPINLDVSQTINDIGDPNTISDSADMQSLRVTRIRTAITPASFKASRDRFDRNTALVSSSCKQPITTQASSTEPEMTLSKMVETFLFQQHAQCPHPVSVCPKFSLHHAHHCPMPRPNKLTNACQRLLGREVLSGCKLRVSRREDFHFLHRRFQPTIVIRPLDDDLTSCCFSWADEGMFIGSKSGTISWVNIEEDEVPVELSSDTSSAIRRLSHTRNGDRLLICNEWDLPGTAVARLQPSSSSEPSSCPWSPLNTSNSFHILDARYAEFSNLGNQDYVVATVGKTARVYDIQTGNRLADLFSSVKQSGYIINKATFNPSDQLVLNDGVVWDLRYSSSGIGQPVHKLDKFQDLVSGSFHPNGREIIVGSSVWDMRNWNLLHTIQALDRLEVQFHPAHNIIYAGLFALDEDEYKELDANRGNTMQSMFRTLDADTYRLIASIDIRRPIEQMALDTNGQLMAVIERLSDNSSHEPVTQCRLYTLGRKPTEHDPGDEDDEPDEVDDDEEDDMPDDDDQDDDMSVGDLASSSSGGSNSAAASSSSNDDDSSYVSTSPETSSLWDSDDDENPLANDDDDRPRRTRSGRAPVRRSVRLRHLPRRPPTPPLRNRGEEEDPD